MILTDRGFGETLINSVSGEASQVYTQNTELKTENKKLKIDIQKPNTETRRWKTVYRKLNPENRIRKTECRKQKTFIISVSGEASQVYTQHTVS